MHDLFDGLSVNHHEMDQQILRAKRADQDQLCLADEVHFAAEDINDLHKHVDNIIVVKSNHDEFLARYLQKGLYTKDPHNHRFSLKLALAMLDGFDPVRHAIEPHIKNPANVRWLERDEDYKIAGVQLGNHGDRGANGARGNLRSMEEAYGSSVTGHSHVPEILRNSWSVGTSSYLKLEYNVGASSWLHSSCLVYENGSRQLINSINGKYTIG